MCARCDQLEADLKALRQELSYELDKSLADNLQGWFRLTPQRAAILSALYRAKGRVLPHYALTDSANSPAEDHVRLIRVQICHVRNALPKGSIEVVYGQGYRLTPIGLLAVQTALGWHGVADPNEIRGAA